MIRTSTLFLIVFSLWTVLNGCGKAKTEYRNTEVEASPTPSDSPYSFPLVSPPPSPSPSSSPAAAQSQTIKLDLATAFWKTSEGKTFVFPFNKKEDGRAEKVSNVLIEGGGKIASGVLAHPPYHTNAWIEAQLPRRKFPARKTIRFLTEIGVRKASSCTNTAVEFQLIVKEYESLAATAKSTEFRLAEYPLLESEGKKLMSVDLSHLENEIIALILRVNARGNWYCDEAIWGNPRLVIY